MATVQIIKNDPISTSSVKTSNSFISKINEDARDIKIKNLAHGAKKITTSDYFISEVSSNKIDIKITETLPFRVKFMSIGIESYSPSNPAPVGIAVIGINNYIL